MYSIRLLVISAVSLLILMCSGCGDSGSTEYYNVNQSDQKLYVTIMGFTPDATPGNLRPGAGTSQLKEVVLNFSEPVTVDETITISWTTDGGSAKNTVELKRDDLGLPSKVRGGRITFTYTADGKWEIDYSS